MAMQLIKTVKNAKLYRDVVGDKAVEYVLVENVRLSFPAIGHMKEDEDENGKKTKKYKATPMLAKATHVAAKDLFVEVMNNLMKQNEVKIPPEYRCIKNGDDTERDEYQGHWTISCSESRRPAARDERGNLMLNPSEVSDAEEMEAILNRIDEKFYAGCYVNILIRPWYFNGTVKGATKKFPKRICAAVAAIQFFKNGERFSAGQIDDSGIWGDTSEEGEASSGTSLDGDDDGL